MASGDVLVTWLALDNQPPDDDFATYDTILTASTDEPDDIFPVLDFDPGTPNEFAIFMGVLPAHYGAGGFTVDLFWVAEATSGAVKWDVSIKRYPPNAVMTTQTYVGEESTTTTVNNVARELNNTVITLTNSEIDALLVNELFQLAVERDAADAADTMNSNDAELIAVYLKET